MLGYISPSTARVNPRRLGSIARRTYPTSHYSFTSNLQRRNNVRHRNVLKRSIIMTNINGKAYAMNAITPMKPWKTPFLRAFFFVLGHWKWLRTNLVNLSFIHFARWVIVPSHGFPRPNQNQPGETLKYDYLLFFSNFNGTWNQYIDAFSAVLSSGLDVIWDSSEKFPGAVPVTPFKDYIARGQFETDYYYDAYPHATTNDVKAAHRVQAAFDGLATQSAAMSANEFAKAYLQFVVTVQGDLGATGEPPVGT
jgi:hypothetical protein